MSSINQSKTQGQEPSRASTLAGRKRKRDEELMESEPERTTPQKKIGAKNARPKSGKKGSHSSGQKRKGTNSSVADDLAELPEEEESADSQLSGSDDEEDEYDSEDGASLQDFIVDDDQVDEEMEDVDDQEQQKKKHKKKKKKHVERPLDEEDIELIAENTGVEVQRRKRLQKVSELEKHEEQPHASIKRELLQKMNEEQRDLDEDQEMADQSNEVPQASSRQQSNKLSRQMSYDQEQDKENYLAAKKIYKNPVEISDQMKRLKVRERLEEEKAGLEEFFNGDEIDDQFATKADKLIADIDIPERLQIKIGERLATNFEGDLAKDIEEETQYIFQRLGDTTNREAMYHYEDSIKQKIARILQFIRQEYLDVPMIVKYRMFEYKPELQEQDVWMIANLDIEYGKFQQQLSQMKLFLTKLTQFDSTIQFYVDEISKVKSVGELHNYSALISFFKQYYYDELQALADDNKKKLPIKMDQVALAKRQGLDMLTRKMFLDPILFCDNLMHNKIVNKPPVVSDIDQIILPFLKEGDRVEYILNQILRFAAVQLSVQPKVRSQMKMHYMLTVTLSTQPTEQGVKELDVFHPSYHVKHINQQPLRNFINNPDGGCDEKFLDIIQCEKAGLIRVSFNSQDKFESFYQNLLNIYIPHDSNEAMRSLYASALKIVNERLIPEIQKEVCDEIYERVENYVIGKCQESYRQMLMIGPFSREEKERRVRVDDSENNHNIIPDRPRCTVMGVIYQQVDQFNSIVTIAIVDKYGELQVYKDFKNLMPPRPFRAPPQGSNQRTYEEEQKIKKQTQAHNEELREHQKDKDALMDLISKHGVDLIVVGANRLESRTIKKVISEIAQNIKTYMSASSDANDGKRSKRTAHHNDEEFTRKEAFVIWGSLEVPKLFANSHRSNKLLKNTNPVVKQAVSLARFEQDPMNEILNLWSFTPSENIALQLNMHPLQKSLNQAKLADALEDVNVQCVNAVGIDINLILNHDHMHILMSFLSALGPRKSKKLIHDLKNGKQGCVRSRRELYDANNYLARCCYWSMCGFIKIRVHEDLLGKDQVIDLLEQTRIHPESYAMAHKIARDLIFDGREVDLFHTYQAVKSVILNPIMIEKQLDLDTYKQELQHENMINMTILLDYINEEFKNPFKDPRHYRNPDRQHIKTQQLFYMLIDESERTFKKGIIVTGTVTKVMEKLLICKLDNGIDAKVRDADIENNAKNLQDAVKVGTVIQGRIHELKLEDENKFEVYLNCKKRDLEDHSQYVNKDVVHKDDLNNMAFKVDPNANRPGRLMNRRINHPKFRNVASNRAIQDLMQAEIGDYIFRPSSQSQDQLTLTWKFYSGNIVHIAIQERDKLPGATIGSKLAIHDEIYDTLQEIVDRFIVPCNRLVQEACGNAKFKHFESSNELEAALQQEKASEPNKIPYKITILPQYPQHLVLGYIPKQALIKEYIKVKPRGFNFHEINHLNLTNLFNWFKENCKHKEYQKQMKRVKSPRAKVISAQDSNLVGNLVQQRSSQQQDTWKDGLSKDWQQNGGASVHSANDNNDQYQVKSEFGRSYGTGADYNQNQSNMPGDYRSGGGSGRGNCYNCQESGHISKNCPQPRKEQPFRENRGRGDRPPRQYDNNNNYNRGDRGDRDRPRGGGYEREDHTAAWNNNIDQQPTAGGNMWGAAGGSPGGYNPSNADNATAGWQNDNAGGAYGATTAGADSSNAGWGQSSPKMQAESSAGWEDKGGASDNWGGNDGGRSDFQADYNPSGDGDRPRGRGRGGPPGGGKDCFKCGQEGHFSRECPNPGQGRGGRGGGGGNRACFKCGQEGHMSRECPNQDSMPQRGRGGEFRGRGRGRDGERREGGGGSGECFKCHQTGHFARECPNQSSNPGERPSKRQRIDEGGNYHSRRDDDHHRDRGDRVERDRDNGWDKSNNNDMWDSNTGNGAYNPDQSLNNAWDNANSDDKPWNAGANDSSNQPWGKESTQGDYTGGFN